jgi:hypothetical protein
MPTLRPCNIVFPGKSGKPILTITSDGKFLLGPDATVDEAAESLIRAVNRLVANNPRWRLL